MATKNEGGSYQLLLEAESWSATLLKERSMELLQIAVSALGKSDSSYELRLDCLRWIGEKLVVHVEVLELEELILKPFLHSALDYLEEIIRATEETSSHKNTLLLTTIMINILEQSVKVTRHCGDQTDCGIGEMPSLPQVVPRILMSSFNFLLCSKPAEESKDHLTQFFNCCKELLQSFLNVMGAIKIIPVLEDELELLVLLCQDLVKFHDVLVKVDFKASLMVWKVYIQLTNKHLNKLSDKLDLSLATEKISSELRGNLIHLRSVLSSDRKDQTIVKVTMKVVHSLKALLLVAAQSIGRSRSFLKVLQELLVGLPDLPSWIPEVARNNIIAVILSPQNKQTLVGLAAQESFLPCLTEDPLEDPKSLLLLIVELLLLRPPHHLKLFHLALSLVSAGGCCLDLPNQLEGRQVLFKPVVKVNHYTWTLTNLCSYLATSNKQEFVGIEKILLESLLDPASSMITLMLVSDIWCFMARLSSSRLCLSHMKLLRSVKEQMGSTLTAIVIDILLNRLQHFLSGSDSVLWKSLNSGAGDDIPVEDKWKKLAEGEYRPSNSDSCLINLSRLTEDTIRLLPNLPEQKVEIILCSFDQILKKNGYKPDLTITFLRLLRILAKDKKYSPVCLQTLHDVTEQLSPSRNCIGGSICVFQLSSIYQELKTSVPAPLIGRFQGAQGTVPSECVCGLWSAEKAKIFNDKISVETNESSEKSPEPKRRKISDEKENIELAVSKLEKEIEFLCQQNPADLKPFSQSIQNQNRKLQDILNKIDF